MVDALPSFKVYNKVKLLLATTLTCPPPGEKVSRTILDANDI